MDFHEGLISRLLDDAAVSSIADDRIHWVRRPQNEGVPAITLQVVVDPRPAHLGGLDSARSTMVQVDCWAASIAEVVALANGCIAALEPPFNVEEKRFGGAQIVAQRESGEDTVGGQFLYRKSIDLSIWHVGE